MSPAKETYHDAVRAFKKTFLARALQAHNGNRTHTARALGLQRTYLTRLLREFGLAAPKPPRPRPKAPPDKSRPGTSSATSIVERRIDGRARPVPWSHVLPYAARVSFIQPRAV